MSNQTYSPELKDEAVHLVVERGHSVKGVSDRLGASQLSLYTWVNGVKPADESAHQAAELVEAKQEPVKLRAELRIYPCASSIAPSRNPSPS